MPEMYEFSEGFQMKIIALMMRDKGTYLSYRDILIPKYFKKSIHIDLARIIHNFYDMELQRHAAKKTPINTPTIEVLTEEVRKITSSGTKAGLRKQYWDEIARALDEDLSDMEYIKESIIKFGKRAALELAIMDSVDIIEKGTSDFSLVEEKISKAIKVGDDKQDLGVAFFGTAEERIPGYLINGDGVKRIPTGLVGIDKILHGGLGSGELGIVIAPPNRGKSYCLINIGAGALELGYNVVHYTLEMSEPQVIKRYDERMTKKTFDFIREHSNKVLTSIMNMQKSSQSLYNRRGELYVKKYPTSGCNINTIRSHLTMLNVEKGFTPDLIIIDYGDLVQPRKSYSDKRFELESVYLDMRDLAEEYGCPLWSASQANRASLDKKIITLSDLAEAFNKANIADFMVALCQTVEEKADNVMRWYISKNRTGVASVVLDGDIDYATATMMACELTT